MFRSNFQEEGVHVQAKDSKLQAVFSKLSGVLPRAEDLGNSNPKTMSSDIIESVLASSNTPLPVPANWNHHYDHYHHDQCENPNANHRTPSPPPQGTTTTTTSPQDPEIDHTVATLSSQLEAALRSAKRTHLSCGEVLLPCGLLRRISRDIVSMAESEPCGLRGCKLYLLFETSEHCIRLGTVEYDLTTPATFELYLTLKQSSNGWHFLPQFIRNLRRGGTIVVSPAYTISKKKLYRSYREE